MSALQENSRALGVSFIPNDGPRDPSGLADCVLSFYDAVGLKPTGLSVIGLRTKYPRFTEKALRAAISDPATRAVSLWPERSDGGSEVHCYLRPRDPANREFEVRFVTMVSNRVPVLLTSPVRHFMEEMTRLYSMQHGCLGGYRSCQYAAQECSSSGAVSPLELDEETRDRLRYDDRNYDDSKRLLRRLYPVTIIGPELWAKLPALPEETGTAVKVEDLGNCKMLTCWPELVEPHDPAFLAGTKALRRWVWPHTIQNPADEPDAVDRKLETQAAVIDS
jgi:hypothetical protein